jgi:hypothetical protein
MMRFLAAPLHGTFRAQLFIKNIHVLNLLARSGLLSFRLRSALRGGAWCDSDSTAAAQLTRVCQVLRAA